MKLLWYILLFVLLFGIITRENHGTPHIARITHHDVDMDSHRRIDNALRGIETMADDSLESCTEVLTH